MCGTTDKREKKNDDGENIFLCAYGVNKIFYPIIFITAITINTTTTILIFVITGFLLPGACMSHCK